MLSGPFFIDRSTNRKPEHIVTTSMERQDPRGASTLEGEGTHNDAFTDNILTASGELDARRSQTELRLPGGQVLRVPTAFLLKQAGRGGAESFEGRRVGENLAGTDPMTIPVIEEQMAVSKRTVVTGTVVLERETQEYHETLDVPLVVRTFDVERVVRNIPITAAPPVRQEGDTTIYPLVEEQLVLTTQLMLKEEVRVTRRDTERRDTRTVTLRRDLLTVTRKPAPEGAIR